MNRKDCAERRIAAAKRAEAIIEEALGENRALTDDEAAKVEGYTTEAKEWQAKEQAAANAEGQRDELARLAGGASSDAAHGEAEGKSIGERIRESREYQALRAGNLKTATVLTLNEHEFKTLVTLTTASPQNLRRPNVVQMAMEERTVADLMLESTVDRGSVEYYEETTVTNAAATVAEGAAKPESALAFTLRTDAVRKIATWIPATDEVLADVVWMEGQIRGRLVFMVKRAEETQLLTGDGIAPNILGLLNRSGIQTQAKGADITPTAIFRAINKVRNTGYAEPTGLVMHPNDWADMVLLQGTDGQYLFGPLSQNLPERVWGLDIRITSAITEGTALVGAFRPHAEVLRRTGIAVVLSTEHSTYFVENKVAILAEERLGLAAYRPTAFCTVTGI